MRTNYLLTHCKKFVSTIKRLNQTYKISHYEYFLLNEQSLTESLKSTEALIDIKNQRFDIMIALFVSDFKKSIAIKESEFFSQKGSTKKPSIARDLKIQAQSHQSIKEWKLEKKHIDFYKIIHSLKFDFITMKFDYSIGYNQSNINENIIQERSLKKNISKKSIEELCSLMVENIYLRKAQNSYEILKNVKKEELYMEKALAFNKQEHSEFLNLCTPNSLILKAFQLDFLRKNKIPVYFSSNTENLDISISVLFKNEFLFIALKSKEQKFLHSLFPGQKVRIDFRNNSFFFNKAISEGKSDWQHLYVQKEFNLTHYKDLLNFVTEEYKEYFKIDDKNKENIKNYYVSTVEPFLKERISILSCDNFILSTPDLSKINIYDLQHLRFPVVIKYGDEEIYNKKITLKNKQKFFTTINHEIEKKVIFNSLKKEQNNNINKRRL